MAQFPKGADKSLEDLKGWFLEFNRVGKHCDAGSKPTVGDQIANLIACWGSGTKVGDALRNRARESDYLAQEALNDDVWCWTQLEEVVYRKEVPAARRRRNAEEEWKALNKLVDEELADFDSKVDRVVTKMSENNVLPSARDQLLKYLDCLDVDCAKHLERHHAVETVNQAKTHAAEYFDVELAYAKQTDGTQRQRAT